MSSDNISFNDLPSLGEPIRNGVFAGITTLASGQHAAVVLLPDKPPRPLSWAKAVAWAKGLQAELPSRPIAALLYANAKPHFEPEWHWTSEQDEDDASYAWCCGFGNGGQYYYHKSWEACARAVRLIHITA